MGMKSRFDSDAYYAELCELWPKKRSEFDCDRDKIAFVSKIVKQESYDEIKNIVECLVEDTGIPAKLPNLSEVIVKYARTRGKPMSSGTTVLTTAPPVDVEELYQRTNNKEASEAFIRVWNIWPRVPDYVERHKLALEAFLAAAKVFPPADLETATTAYANAFNSMTGGQIYPKSLKNFVSDINLLEEWVERARVAKSRAVDRTHFEAAYAWYPEFSGKGSERTIDASWVVYWRKVLLEERLDFLAYVNLYRRDRNQGDGIQFTKSFVVFCAEHKNMFSGPQVREAKTSLFARHVEPLALANGLDLRNIWGDNNDQPFTVQALTCLCETMLIKQAIREWFQRSVQIVWGCSSGNEKLHKIKDLVLAEEQVKSVDVDKLTDAVYNAIFDQEITKKPVVVSNVSHQA
jgi:hypothetical protein